MTHEISWLKPDSVLLVVFNGYQTPETLKTCLDEQAAFMDTVSEPVIVLISWLDVTGMERNTLMSQLDHRAYNHPMAARAVLVGFDQVEGFQNEVAVANTRGGQSHTRYFNTMEEATDYLEEMLGNEASDSS